MDWKDRHSLKEEGQIELSIVVPVYNEKDNIEMLTAEIRRVCNALGKRYEIIYVDDGSTDSSGDLIKRLAMEIDEVRGLHFTRNCGQTAAFDAGFKAARGKIIVTMDADLQNDPADIPSLLAHLKNYDAAIGWRFERQDNLVRRVSSKIANAVRNKLSGDSITDTGCSLKAFRSECIKKIKLYKGMHRFFPTLLRMEGYRVVEVKVRHRRRLSGEAKYGIGNRMVRGFVDLLVVRWMRKRKLDYEIKDYED
ncbi:MAG: glycosyltransferase family 2 protein [Acidobacteriota bacterium]